MTLQSSGQIALSDLRTEYTNLGSRGQVAMNDFYYGGTHLKKNICTDQARGDSSHPTKSSHFDNIPAVGDGQIKLSNFYGKVYYYARQSTVQISGSNASINVNSIEDEALKKNSNNTVFFVAQTNGNCKSTSTGNYGLTIPQGGRSNTTCYLINDHAVYGKGGRGGDGNGNNGENGGTALSLATNIYLKNNNRILGGGGGGGGGSGRTTSYNECYCCNVTNGSIAGSGGGGGKGDGAGGSAGTAPSANFRYSGGNGSPGDENTSSVPGSGGSGGSSCSYNTVLGTYCSNTGGNGGGWGQSGSPGTSGGNGGSAGDAIRRRSGAYYVVLTSGTTAGSTVTF